MATFLRTLAARYDHGHEIGDHAHGWGQLIYASSGAIHVAAAGQAWLIPSARAVWLPPGTPHRLRMRGTTRLRTLYIPPARCAALAPRPLGLMVSPLLRELILELVRFGHIDADDRAHGAVAEAMLVMLGRAERLPLSLTLPTDRPAARVAEAILADPGNNQFAHAAAPVSGGNRHDTLRMAPACAADGRGGAIAGWEERDGGGVGSGLFRRQRVHPCVPRQAGPDTVGVSGGGREVVRQVEGWGGCAIPPKPPVII